MSKSTEFAALVLSLDNGATHAEISDRLGELVERVRATGKGGSLTLTLRVDPRVGRTGAVNQVTVKDAISVKLPEFPRAESIFYADDDNSLTREDPNQPDLTGLQFPGRNRVRPHRADVPAGVDPATGEVTDTYNDDKE